MSGRILSHRLTPLVRTGLARHIHNAGSRTGGVTTRRWRRCASRTRLAHRRKCDSQCSCCPKLLFRPDAPKACHEAGESARYVWWSYDCGFGLFSIPSDSSAGDTAGSTAAGIFQGIQNAAEQTQRGWSKTTEEIEFPEWLQKILRMDEESQSEHGGGGKEPKEPGNAAAGAAAATTAAFGYDQSNEDDTRAGKQAADDDQMMLLTRKMIEIRTILQTVGQSGSLTLPSIVVIGSQSSGKSSVLEAIVGHEFLPKGSNMRTLTDLNLAVPDKECVSDDPIQLNIYSPNVPDLSMIDLPGYIQVAGHDQPPELKQKISDLCDKYIQPPNIILAISAADVDLANSTALRASRRVDPRGQRTIGVITKMDLVDPERGHDILTDKKYPLRLGYVGVVSRIPSTTALFSRGSGNVTSAILKNENAYFSAHPTEFGPHSDTQVGVSTLRKKLMHVLEQTMASSLSGTRDAISQELEEVTYEFKVQYNDRPLSAESYLAESLDGFKHSFKAFTEAFGRPQVREMLKAELDQRVMDILAQRYWNKPVEDLDPPMAELDPLKDLPKADPESLYWHRKLDASCSTLTKLGIGRLATTVVANALQNHVNSLLANSTFASHPGAHKQIMDACTSILNERFFSTSDQVENCIKPYKFEIEVDDTEWSKGRENVAKVLKEELRACESAIKHVEDMVGKTEIEGLLEGNGSGGAGGFSAALLERGREGLFLRDRAELIKMRLMAVKSKQCATQKNKYYCPEVFLDVVADKLTSTAVLFLNVELLSEFYYNFPRELDLRLGRHLSDEEIERFAREDPRIRRHLDIIRKKELLELALQKIEGIRQLDGRNNQRDQERAPPSKDTGSRWGLF
ncbi:hypothetical protein N7470_004001 [Penicillium chermesinum]|nr:hypothetical protein N7470_004001 [Penicillium chermesinum]